MRIRSIRYAIFSPEFHEQTEKKSAETSLLVLLLRTKSHIRQMLYCSTAQSELLVSYATQRKSLGFPASQFQLATGIPERDEALVFHLYAFVVDGWSSVIS
jgi:hypothetical protein